MDCRNCQESITAGADYCHHCGAKVVREPLRFNSLFNDIWRSITNVDRGLWATIRDLSLRPGEVILGYLDGLRKRYTSPGSYALIVAAVYGLLSIIAEDIYLHEEMMEGITQGAGQAIEGETKRYLVALRGPLLLFPVFTIFLLNWLFYRRQQRPIGHAVVSLYYYAHALLLYLFVLTAMTVISQETVYRNVIAVIFLSLFVAVALYCKIKIYSQVYEHSSRFMRWFKPSMLLLLGAMVSLIPYFLFAILAVPDLE